MFIGHFSAAFVAKAMVPEAPLPALLIASQLTDILVCGFVTAKLERMEIDPTANPTVPLRSHSIPYSHSLLSAVIQTIICVIGLALFYSDATRSMLWAIALVCYSHWILDFITHDKDLPLATPRTKVGLGLWNNRKASIALELGLIVLGTTVLALSGVVTPWKVWALGAALTAVQAVSFAIKPPNNIHQLFAMMIAVYVAVAFAGWWVDLP